MGESTMQGIGKPVFQDNWQHRSAGLKCATCMWFVKKATNGNAANMSVKGVLGRCRRHAPTISGFPAVYSTDWCGDHKVDENKQ